MQADIRPVEERWALREGVVAEQRPLSINADANVKLNHYKECGTTTSAAYRDAGVQPQIAAYFGLAGDLAHKLQAVNDGMQDGGDATGAWLVLHRAACCSCQ